MAALAPAVAPMPVNLTALVNEPVLTTLTTLASSPTRPACFSANTSTSGKPRLSSAVNVISALNFMKFNAEITLTALDNLGLPEVDVLALKQAGLVGELAKVVKVVKTGSLTKAVKLTGIGATAGAKAAIEAAGGSLA